MKNWAIDTVIRKLETGEDLAIELIDACRAEVRAIHDKEHKLYEERCRERQRVGGLVVVWKGDAKNTLNQKQLKLTEQSLKKLHLGQVVRLSDGWFAQLSAFYNDDLFSCARFVPKT